MVMTFRRIVYPLAVIAAAILAGGCGMPPSVSQPAKLPSHSVVAASAARPAAAAARGNVTEIAMIHGDVPGSPEPGAAQNTTVPSTWYGYPSILPVIGSAPNWVKVRLAQRPNGSTTWVPQSDVTLSVTTFRMVLDLASEHLIVYQSGKELYDFPAGIGTPDDPTVTGEYFIAMRVPPPNAAYGPLVLVTSAHSDAISDWDGSGDAIIAIHGPITSYDDALIGTTGAAISHGCIRLHDAELAQLADIPPGTPLDIISGAS
jgi:lipoprotein-anchoring transpeptidase ErfK/SrfK